jgi:hypothetical protein
LNQSKHYDVAYASCSGAGLPDSFCQRVATEDYDVDHNEFDDLSAHSQIPVGWTTCDAANQSLWRVFWLGGQIREAIGGVVYSPSQAGNDRLAQHLGRALHTVQDNCAHSGMPNPQHAWHSLNDVCEGTSESPDLQPAAFVCAQQESDAIVSAFVDTLHDIGGDYAQLADVDTDFDKHYPAYASVCEFLASASDWDGVDRRWDNNVVRPALTGQLLAGLSGADDSQFTRVCGGGFDVYAAYSDPDFDTSSGPESCVAIHAFCLGKADGVGGEQAPPYETDPLSATPAKHGGCEIGGAPSPVLYELAMILSLLLYRARRRRSRQLPTE